MLVRKTLNSLDLKVIIIGDPAVGKTSILNQFNNKTFVDNYDSTIGASFLTKHVETANGPIGLLIWDTAGQERYRSLIPMYSRSAAAALLVIDVSNPSTVDTLDEWLTTLREACPDHCRYYLCANKIDLDVQIDMEKVKEWANQNKFVFFTATAMKYESVEPIFQRIAEDMSASELNVSSRQSDAQPVQSPQTSQTNCC